MHGEYRPKCLLVALKKAQKQVQCLNEIVGMVSGRGQMPWSSYALAERTSLLSQRSLAKLSLLLEERRGENALVMEDPYSLFTSKVLQSISLERVYTSGRAYLL